MHILTYMYLLNFISYSKERSLPFWFFPKEKKVLASISTKIESGEVTKEWRLYFLDGKHFLISSDIFPKHR